MFREPAESLRAGGTAERAAVRGDWKSVADDCEPLHLMTANDQ